MTILSKCCHEPLIAQALCSDCHEHCDGYDPNQCTWGGPDTDCNPTETWPHPEYPGDRLCKAHLIEYWKDQIAEIEARLEGFTA